MNKYLKWTLIGIVSLGILFVIVGQVGRMLTKRHSPEKEAVLEKGDLKIAVRYSGPSKNDREIFGGLVPFGEVWRTGANEATVFETSQDLVIQGKTLPAGKYSLFTIPDRESWQVIWNGKEYSWGLNFDGTSPIDRTHDVVVATVPVEFNPNTVEVLDISVSASEGLSIAWDQTKVTVPLDLYATP